MTIGDLVEELNKLGEYRGNDRELLIKVKNTHYPEGHKELIACIDNIETDGGVITMCGDEC